MYVHIVSFDVKEGNETTFLEMQKFEEKQDAKPVGLDHYHIFKDRSESNKYWLLEYWDSKASKDKLEETEMHKKFHELRDPLFKQKYESFECDVLV